jgi:Uma2 family endonuclease
MKHTFFRRAEGAYNQVMHATAHILDEPSIRDAALPITVAQYHRLSADGIVPERTELLQGVIIEQMTKSPLHTFLVQRLAGWLASAVSSGLYVRKEEPLTLADSEPEPDIAVVAGSPSDYRHVHPASATLVIEVAIATVGIDRAKADVYAAAGVEEYWIVIPESRSVEIHRLPTAVGYGSRIIAADPQAVVQPESLPGATITIDRLFA